MKPDQNYALIVVPLQGVDLNIRYIRTNAKVIIDIASNLKLIHNEYNTIEIQKRMLSKGKNGVSVDIEEQTVRFKIVSDIRKSTDIPTIEEFVINNFSQKTSHKKQLSICLLR